MASLQAYREEQLKKLAKLQAKGIDPYPATSQRSHSISEIKQDFDQLSGQSVCLAGRLLSQRQHGGVAFLDLADASGQLQLLVRQDDLESARGQLGFSDLDLLTRGDFIEAAGQPGLSQRGEQSLLVTRLRLLTKVLRPLPEKLDDVKTRRRRRYLDLAINPDTKERFERRSKWWRAVRRFLDDRGFIEISIPVLEHTTGGAEAKPFKTHMDALDQDFYLRISHELPLKKLLGGGFEKVYDLGPRFRNENYSDEHLPEHLAFEYYWAYADWQAGRRLSEEMIREVSQATFGRTTFKFRDQTIDLAQPWSNLDFATVIKDNYGLDVFNTSLEEVAVKLQEYDLVVEDTTSLAAGLDKLWKRLRADLAGPAWLINHPTFMSPLAKAEPERPEVTQRFQAIVAGSELAHGFSELNDPLEQLARFRRAAGQAFGR